MYSNTSLPSDLEGIPLSLLEAMSYGNCCLVSDIDECAEVVEDKAVLFQKGNTEDLKQKMQTLCECPEQVELYRKDAEDFICQKYSWDDVIQKTLTLYEKR